MSNRETQQRQNAAAGSPTRAESSVGLNDLRQANAEPTLRGPFSGKTFIFFTNSFSLNSGGRTSSIFQRCRLFESMGATCFIATMNFKADYAEIFSKLCRRHGVANATLLNPFQFLAGERVFRNFAPERRVKPLESHNIDDFRFESIDIEDERHYTGTKEDGVLWHITLHTDGSPSSAQIEADGQIIEKRAFDKAGITLRRQLLDSTGTIFLTNYYTIEGFCYLSVQFNSRGDIKKLQWFGLDDGTVREFSSQEEMWDLWIEHLAQQHPDAYFVSEVRAIDSSLLHNVHGTKVKTIAQIHSTFFAKPYTFGSETNEYLAEMLDQLDEYDLAVTLTHQERSHIAALYGDHDNLVAIPHPFALPTIEEDVRKEPHSLAVCSRLDPLKRIDHIILAVKKAKELVPDISLRIYGKGDDLPRLMDVVEREGLESVVHFMGFTSKPALAMAQASLTVSASLYEGFGMSTLESLSVGTPVISYDYLYGPAEFIEDGLNGRLVPNGNIDALAQAIADILLDQQLLETMSRNAPAILQKESPDKIAGQWIEAIRYIDSKDSLRALNESAASISRFKLEDLRVETIEGDCRTVMTLEARKTFEGVHPQGYQLHLYPIDSLNRPDFDIIEGYVASRTPWYDTVEFDFTIPCQRKRLYEGVFATAKINVKHYGSNKLLPIDNLFTEEG